MIGVRVVVPGGSLHATMRWRMTDPAEKARLRAHMAERKESLSRGRRARRLVKYRVGLLVCPAVPDTEQAWRGWR